MRQLIHTTTGLISLALLLLIFLLAGAGPFFSGYPYDAIDLSIKNQAPTWSHWFGTDDLGRDLFTRTCQGARISLFVGISAALVDLMIGILWGSAAALLGRRVDKVMMRVADILYAIPQLLIVILLMVVLGPSLLSIVISLTILGWITMARIVRGQVLQIKQSDYVSASMALGANFLHIVWKHLIPNAAGSIIATVIFTISSAIFTEAFLSFLGLGVQAPVASWGTMANDGLPSLSYYPWRLFFPAFFISITILAFNLLGDTLHNATGNKRTSHSLLTEP